MRFGDGRGVGGGVRLTFPAVGVEAALADCELEFDAEEFVLVFLLSGFGDGVVW